MESSTKQKILIFTLMTLVFLASVLIRQVLETGSLLPAAGAGSVIREDLGEEAEETSAEEASETGPEEAADPVPVVVPEEIVVDVKGAVASPGVVRLPEGSRVYEAVEAAGGRLETADSGRVNLAEILTDGAAIYIPFEGEEEAAPVPGVSSGVSAPGGGAGNASGLININTADKSALMQLPGIGEVYAQSIIDYRQSVGPFKTIEDVKNVSGIGDRKFEKMKELITV